MTDQEVHDLEIIVGSYEHMNAQYRETNVDIAQANARYKRRLKQWWMRPWHDMYCRFFMMNVQFIENNVRSINFNAERIQKHRDTLEYDRRDKAMAERRATQGD